MRRKNCIFNYRQGHFKFERMCFRLSNGGATFQRLMERVFQKKSSSISILIYFDDLIIYSPDPETHIEHLRIVFELIRKAGLRLKLSICHFACKEVNFLGTIISAQGIKPDQNNV